MSGPCNVIRRSTAGEILAYGGEGRGLYDALVEVDARNLLLPEGAGRWATEPAAPENWPAEVDPSDVNDFLVNVLGVSQDEANRLMGDA